MNELQTQTITDCVIINTMPLAIKEYNNRRVVTFKDIDTLHQRPKGTARKRFNDNKSRFIEGEDYFKVCASEFRTRKIANISSKAQEDITLITESGYLMLVKSLTDDLAWKVQRELVNTYFRAKDMFTVFQTFSQTLLNRISSLETEMTDMKLALETQKPIQPNFWLWKNHIATKVIKTLRETLSIDRRTAYDMVYDSMTSIYGFDKSFAISQFCSKYRIINTTENPAKIAIIDAVADVPEYQREFIEAVNHIIGADRKISYPKNIENAVEVTIPDIQSYDRVQQAIIPLIQRYGDNTPNGSKTYRVVYKRMGKSNKVWKNMQTRYHCKSKKELLLKYDKYYDEFVQAINDLISDGEVTPDEP